MIIAIDGPAGAGKSTVAKLLAKKLGVLYLDTGAMYRALSLKVLKEKIPLQDTPRIIAASHSARIELVTSPEGYLEVFLDGRDVSREIRSSEVTAIVSDVAKIKEVREVLLGLQRDLGSRHSLVLDGRDIGTVVFPDAEKKFFLDADFKERVNRRHKELKEAGQPVTWEEVACDLKNRDRIDSSREVAPLKKAEDAVYLDTTRLSIEQVVERLYAQVNQP
jgi:cytidylate kinase